MSTVDETVCTFNRIREESIEKDVRLEAFTIVLNECVLFERKTEFFSFFFLVHTITIESANE